MKINKLFAIGLLGLLAATLLVSPVLAQSGAGCSESVVGGACRLLSGQTLERLSILGGAVTLDEGSLVRGDVGLAGGSLVVSGEVRGNISALGGTVNLTDSAHVLGNITTFGASLRRSDKARVDGTVNVQSPDGYMHTFTLPQILTLPQTPAVPVVPQPAAGEFMGRFDLLESAAKFLWWVFRTLAVSALALLVMLFLPHPVRRVARTASARPVVVGGMGCLSLMVVVTLSFLLIVTILLSPVGVIGLLVLMVAALFGWMAVGYEVGQRLARMLNVNWPEPVTAGLGTLLLTLVAGAAEWIPCIGWLVPAAVVLLAVGAVAISRFGSRGPEEVIAHPPANPPGPDVVPVNDLIPAPAGPMKINTAGDELYESGILEMSDKPAGEQNKPV